MEKKEPVQANAAQPPPPPPSSNPAPPRRGRVWPWILGAILVILALLIFIARRKQAPAENARSGGRGGFGQQAVSIDTATAQKGDIGVYISAIGTVTPYYVVSNRTRVDGQILKIYYKEGQLVHEGDPLADIDPSPFEAAVIQAQGQLARDNALLENARLDLDRYKEAFSKNAIPKQQLDTQGATVHQYEGVVKLDEGQLTNAQVQLDYTHIKSPITGRVGLRLVDPGNIVHASDNNPIVVVTQTQPITVIFSVAEDYLPQIVQQLRQGKKLEVDALDRSQQKKLASGVLLSLDNQIDPNTGTLKMKAIFTNEDETLFANQFVNARLLVDTHRGVTLLPHAVIQQNSQQGNYVYLVQNNGTNNTVAIKPVDIITTEGETSEVQGIGPGAVVAASNFNRLTDGGKVTLRSEGGGRQRNGVSGTNSPAGRGSRTNSAAAKGKRKSGGSE
ncbi:MAG TPA: efflux RND transporter periplasmic adaptor subunit [Candidatus Angelobacter sp.]|nr:efflux RND transporter periplasmic adaptor subunit [Candidatus Angelobacter sp.]